MAKSNYGLAIVLIVGFIILEIFLIWAYNSLNTGLPQIVGGDSNIASAKNLLLWSIWIGVVGFILALIAAFLVDRADGAGKAGWALLIIALLLWLIVAILLLVAYSYIIKSPNAALFNTAKYIALIVGIVALLIFIIIVIVGIAKMSKAGDKAIAKYHEHGYVNNPGFAQQDYDLEEEMKILNQ